MAHPCRFCHAWPATVFLSTLIFFWLFKPFFQFFSDLSVFFKLSVFFHLLVPCAGPVLYVCGSFGSVRPAGGGRTILVGHLKIAYGSMSHPYRFCHAWPATVFLSPLIFFWLFYLFSI